MARKKSEPVYTGKYTVDEMTKIDLDTISKMGRSELAKVVSRMSDVSKKRLKTLERNSDLTPAYYGIKERSENGDMSVKGKSLNELRAMYVQQKSFLTAKTSTRRGAEEVRKAEEKRLGVEFESKEDRKNFWEKYSKFLETEEGKTALYTKGSEVVQQMVADMIVNDELTDEEILQRIRDSYEDDFDDYDDYDEYDDFYDLDDF